MEQDSSDKKEFIIVCMIGGAESGQRFTMWPHHITLLPWFEAVDVHEVIKAVGSGIEKFGSVDTETTERAYLGLRKQPVILVENTDKLQTLHNKLLGTIQQNGWPIKGRWVGDLFKPHITQKMGKDYQGKVKIDEIYIVESQAQGYRQIVGRIEL